MHRCLTVASAVPLSQFTKRGAGSYESRYKSWEERQQSRNTFINLWSTFYHQAFNIDSYCYPFYA
jgi:hypothetical protein